MKCNVGKVLYKVEVDNLLKLRLANYDDFDKMFCRNQKSVDDVYNYLLELYSNIDKETKNNYISNIIVGLISYVNWYNFDKIELDSTVMESLKKIETQYKEYIEKYNKKEDSDIKFFLSELNKILEENQLSEQEKKLLNENQELFNNLELATKKIQELSSTIDSYEERIKKLDENDEIISQLKKKLEKSINELNKKIQELTDKNKKLESEKGNIQKKYNDRIQTIELLKKQIQELTTKNDELNKNIQELQNQLNDINTQVEELLECKKIKLKKTQKKEEELDNYLLDLLLTGEYTLNQLIIKVKEFNSNYEKEDISESLKRINKKINISSPFQTSIPEVYTTCSPKWEYNKNILIPNQNSQIDLLVTSDWHLSNDVEMSLTLKKVDRLYEYCAEKGINYIINLGDFLDVSFADSKTMYYENMKLLESIIKEFPSDDNIYHAILSGNHDERLLQIGIDPIKYLATDFSKNIVSLGYNYATIKFSNDTSEVIGVHHPNLVGIDLKNIEETERRLAYYRKYQVKDNSIDKKSVYLDLYGHFHLLRLDQNSNFMLIPALLKNNSACHFQIHFNENKTINYIIVYPLSFDKSNNKYAEAGSEFVYKKRK